MGPTAETVDLADDATEHADELGSNASGIDDNNASSDDEYELIRETCESVVSEQDTLAIDPSDEVSVPAAARRPPPACTHARIVARTHARACACHWAHTHTHAYMHMHAVESSLHGPAYADGLHRRLAVVVPSQALTLT